MQQLLVRLALCIRASLLAIINHIVDSQSEQCASFMIHYITRDQEMHWLLQWSWYIDIFCHCRKCSFWWHEQVWVGGALLDENSIVLLSFNVIEVLYILSSALSVCSIENLWNLELNWIDFCFGHLNCGKSTRFETIAPIHHFLRS